MRTHFHENERLRGKSTEFSRSFVLVSSYR